MLLSVLVLINRSGKVSIVSHYSSTILNILEKSSMPKTETILVVLQRHF